MQPQEIASPDQEGNISEEPFRSLVETAHDAIFFTNHHGVVLFWNRAAEEMFGYRAEEMAGKPLTLIIPDRLREAYERGVERALSGSLPVSGKTTEITGRRRNGEEFPLELTLATWKSGDHAFLTAIARDITGRREAEEDLRQSEERYRNLFEESPIALWEEDFTDLKVYLDALQSGGVHDFEKYFEEHPAAVSECLEMIKTADVNRSALQMYGARRKKDLLHGLRDIMCEESRGPLGRALAALAEGRKIFETECVTRTLNGRKNQVFLRWVVAPGRTGSQTRLLLSAVDITAHRQLEARLAHAQKMEAVGRLAGGIAHDFNNLLSAITANTDYLLSELKREEPMHEAASVIDKTVNEASRLIHQLLTLSRRQELKLEILDLNASISKLDQILPHILGRDIECTFDLGDDLPRIRAHPGQLEQVLLNLVVNAREAMPEGGKLSVATSAVSGKKDSDGIPVGLPPGRYVKLTVTDSGSGISPEDMEHIFEPFYTTKKEGGLGLSTVYGIVSQLGGEISVKSSPGKGAVFMVYLPAA